MPECRSTHLNVWEQLKLGVACPFTPLGLGGQTPNHVLHMSDEDWARAIKSALVKVHPDKAQTEMAKKAATAEFQRI